MDHIGFATPATTVNITMTVMKNNASDIDRAFDAIVNRIVTPLLKHRDEICRSDLWTDEMRKILFQNSVLEDIREIAKRELAAVHFGVCEELQ